MINQQNSLLDFINNDEIAQRVFKVVANSDKGATLIDLTIEIASEIHAEGGKTCLGLPFQISDALQTLYKLKALNRCDKNEKPSYRFSKLGYSAYQKIYDA